MDMSLYRSFSAKMSFLFKKSMMDVLANALLLHTDRNRSNASTIRFINPSHHHHYFLLLLANKNTQESEFYSGLRTDGELLEWLRDMLVFKKVWFRELETNVRIFLMDTLRWLMVHIQYSYSKVKEQRTSVFLEESKLTSLAIACRALFEGRDGDGGAKLG